MPNEINQNISPPKDPASTILETFVEFSRCYYFFLKLHFMSKIILGAIQTKSCNKLIYVI